MMRVATYADHRRAVRAAARLREDGWANGEVVIEPSARERRRVAPPERLSRRSKRWAQRGALVAGVVGFLAAIVVDDALAAVAGVVLGLLGGLFAAVAVRAVKNVRSGRHRVVPTRYHVLVAREAARADHLLAKWWDPSLSPPARTPSGERVLA